MALSLSFRVSRKAAVAASTILSRRSRSGLAPSRLALRVSRIISLTRGRAARTALLLGEQHQLTSSTLFLGGLHSAWPAPDCPQ